MAETLSGKDNRLDVGRNVLLAEDRLHALGKEKHHYPGYYKISLCRIKDALTWVGKCSPKGKEGSLQLGQASFIAYSSIAQNLLGSNIWQES